MTKMCYQERFYKYFMLVLEYILLSLNDNGEIPLNLWTSDFLFVLCLVLNKLKLVS